MVDQQQTAVNEKLLIDTIEQAENILVTTHFNIDLDAVCSLLLMRAILKDCFHKKNYKLLVREPSYPGKMIRGLPGAAEIQAIPLDTPVSLQEYDLIIIVDAQDASRCTGPVEYKKDYQRKTIVFDHHSPAPQFSPLLVVNQHLSSASEQIFATFSDIFPDIRTDSTVATLTQIGIAADTGRFLYKDLIRPQTFQYMADLYAIAPVDFELALSRVITLTRGGIKIVHHMLSNLGYGDDFAYSWIDPEFMKQNTFDTQDIRTGADFFLNMMRNVDTISWWFTVREHTVKGMWKISFRSISGKVEVLPIAKELGGGGHPNAAGVEIPAKTVHEAVKKVLSLVQATEMTTDSNPLQKSP
ncbi:MAG: DHH family phosphoesterase [Candidatus Dojkabacteria bacterium]|nr:DHH family phosphoesterase [Candidatus Dojkabacteria bacterium]